MITLDLETKGYADLKKVGPWAYSEDPTTEIVCVCWGIDDGSAHAWWPGKRRDAALEELFGAVEDGVPVETHNVAFERSMWENVLTPRHGWPLPRPEQWRDTMAVAGYYALPQALDKLARVLGFEAKDPAGERLITKYSKLYLKTAKTEIPQEDFEKFVAYCRKDVLIEQAVSDFLGDLPDQELEYFLLDQEINRRGLRLDPEGIAVASRVVEKRAADLTAKFEKLTGLKPTQTTKVLAWLHDNGAAVENLQKDTLEEALEKGIAGEDDEFTALPVGPARSAIEIRLKINKASTKKLTAMARQMGQDGRARFQTRYHGAATGRDTGSGFQPLNLNRGFDDSLGYTPEMLIRDIGYGDPKWLDMLYGDAMDCVAKATRHWIMPDPDKRIVAGDFVSIEAVVLACVAGEDWKIEAFREKKPIYEMMGEKIYGLPPGTVTKKTHPQERFDGKTGELAFGYQGALGAWRKFDSSDRHTDERVVEICKAWRAEHPMIVRLWRALEDCAVEAVRRPGSVQEYRGVEFEVIDEWLTMRLLDGKRIWYWQPQLRTKMPPWHKPAEYEDCAQGSCDCKPQPAVTYMAMKEGQWRRVYTYGGKLTENCIQATSRQILMPAVKAVNSAGYPVILKVYDEIVTEPEQSFGSVAEFEEILLDAVRHPDNPWANWPIRVDAWEGARYKK